MLSKGCLSDPQNVAQSLKVRVAHRPRSSVSSLLLAVVAHVPALAASSQPSALEPSLGCVLPPQICRPICAVGGICVWADVGQADGCGARVVSDHGNQTCFTLIPPQPAVLAGQ
jgi:hypothetical protein